MCMYVNCVPACGKCAFVSECGGSRYRCFHIFRCQTLSGRPPHALDQEVHAAPSGAPGHQPGCVRGSPLPQRCLCSFIAPAQISQGLFHPPLNHRSLKLGTLNPPLRADQGQPGEDVCNSPGTHHRGLVCAPRVDQRHVQGAADAGELWLRHVHCSSICAMCRVQQVRTRVAMPDLHAPARGVCTCVAASPARCSSCRPSAAGCTHIHARPCVLFWGGLS